MRIAVVADVHFGNHQKPKNGVGKVVSGMNDRARLVLDTLDRAIKAAGKVDAFVICGDLFDNARPPPQMLAEVQKTLDQVPFIILAGNHDRSSSAPGDHALGPLNPVANIVEEPTVISLEDFDLLCFPYRTGQAKAYFEDEIAKLAEQSESQQRLLFFHLGVQDEKTPEYLKGAHDCIDIGTIEKVMRKHNILYSFAGNWHEHKHRYVIDGLRGVVQCGTLCPTGWDNSGVDDWGMLTIFDSNERPLIKTKEIPGPRFITIRGLTAADTIIATARRDGHTVFVRWRAKINDLQMANEELSEWQAAGLIKGYTVEVDDEEVEGASKAAAKAARKADTLAKALADFVNAMPLEDGIDRSEVLERAKGYIG